MKKCQNFSFLILIMIWLLALGSSPVFAQLADGDFTTALKKSDRGDSKGAITLYTKVIEVDSTYYLAYYNCGVEKKKLGDYAGAIADFSEAIKINPDYKTYYGRAKSKQAIMDLQGAIMDFTKAIEINPDHLSSYFDRGIDKLITGEVESGRSDLKRAKELLSQL